MLLRSSAVIPVAAAFGFPPAALAQAVNLGQLNGNNITPDGRTATTLSVSGRTTDIRTTTISGGRAYNSFSNFGLAANNTANLYVPSNANVLVNIVRNSAVDIQGTLNSYKNGSIGGNVVFADPYGFVVGSQGAVNVGKLTVTTPSAQVLDQMIDARGRVNGAVVDQVLAGKTAISADGSVVVQGTVDARRGVRITAQDVRVAGSVGEAQRYAQRRALFESSVNAAGMVEGGALIAKNGSIQIVAVNDATLNGIVNAGGTARAGGSISVAAGNTLSVGRSAKIAATARKAGAGAASVALSAASVKVGGSVSAKATAGGAAGLIGVTGNSLEFTSSAQLAAIGRGESAGGAIKVKATGTTVIDSGAKFSTAAEGTGNGGAIEISGATVSVASGVTLDASAVSGRAGKLLFDPDNLIIGGVSQGSKGDEPTVGTSALPSIYTQGSDVELDASQSITIAGVIDTRKYSGAHVTGLLSAANNVASTGNSGNITLDAPSITINSGGALYADVNNVNGTTSYKAGDVSLIASVSDTQAQLPSSATTGITINGAVSGGTISASASSTASTVYSNSALGIAQFASTDVFGVITGLSGGYVKAATEAKVTVGSTGSINGGSVTLSSSGSETASDPVIAASFSLAQSVIAAGVVVGVVNANVATEIQSGASINAGNLTVTSTNNASLSVQAVTVTTSTAADGTLAYSTGTLNTRAYIDPGATIVHAGNLTVAANATNSFATSATSIAAGAGQGSIAVAISDVKSNASANLGASASPTGDVLVYAGSNTTANAVSASSQVGSPMIVYGLLNLVNGTPLASLFAPAGAFDKSGAGQTAAASGSSSLSRAGLTLALNESSFGSAASIAALTPDASGTLQAGGAAPAVVAGGKVAVISDLTDGGIRGDAEASILTRSGTIANPSTGAALAMAVNVTQITHTSNAFIGSGATVSGSNVGVSATTTVPITNAWTDFASFSDVTSHLNGNLGIVSDILTSYAEADSKATGTGISGSVNYLQITNNTTAWIGSGAHVTATSPAGCGPSTVSCWTSALDSGGISMSHNWLDNIAVLASTSTQSINVGGNFSWLGVFGTGGTTPDSNAIGGSANADIFASNTVAGIGAGAVINAAHGSLHVDAETADLVYAVAPTSGKGAGLGLNGIVSVLQFDNTTWAGISNGAQVSTASVVVSAGQQISSFDIAGAVGASSSTGVGLAVALASVDTDTKAFIGDVSTALSKSGASSDDTSASLWSGGFVSASSLNVNATTSGRFTTLAVSAQATNNTPDPAATPSVAATDPTAAQMLAAASKFLGIGGDAALSQTTAATDAVDSAQRARSGAFSADVGGSTAGAGAAAVALSSLATSASIDGATVRNVTGGLTVQALNNTIIDTASGGAALSRGAPGTSQTTALAGAVAVGLSSNPTTASITGSNISGGPVSVLALAGGEQTVIGIATALTAGVSQNGTAASVSASVGEITDSVRAKIDGSTISGGGALTIAADQEANIGIGGGSLYIRADGNGSGLGVALTYAMVGDPSSGPAVSATLSNTTVTNVNSLSVLAYDQSRILSGAAVGGGGSNTNGFAGAIVVDEISPTILASISGTGSTSIGVSGDVTVTSSGGTRDDYHAIISAVAAKFNGGVGPTDDSGLDFTGDALHPSATTGAAIFAVAGNVGAGKSNVGVSLVVDRISQANVASIDGVTLTSGGTVAVSATNGADILAVAFGAAVATGSGAGVGSVVYNSIADSVIAQIGHDTPLSGDASGAFAARVDAAAVSVTANDGSTIRGAAGAIALNIGGGNAVGVSAVIDQVFNYVTAEIAGAKVSADQTAYGVTNSVTVAGASNASILTVAVGAAVSSGNQAPGIMSAQDNFRTIVGNLMPATPTALASRGGSGAFFNFAAPPQPSAPASNGIAGAGSIAIATEATTVNAYIAKGAASVGSDVDANANVVLSATNSDAIAAYAGAVSVSAGAGKGIGVSFVLNTIGSNTDAFISNSSVDAQGLGSAAIVDSGLLASDIDPKAPYVPAGNPTFADGTNSVKGIAVVALEQQTVDTVSVVASISSSDRSFAANAVTNLMSGNTKAYGDNASLDTHLQAGSASDVQITAASRAFANNVDIGVALSGGSAAGTVALLVNKMDGQTFAYATNTSFGTRSQAAGNVAIRADAWNGTVGEAVGVAASGDVGVSGSSIANVFAANTAAYTYGGNSYANSLAIKAGTEDGDFASVGNAALGSSAGVGASVILATINNSTQAYLGDQTGSAATSVTLSGPLAVDATTRTATQSYLVGAAIGGTSGVSAAVTLELVTNRTLAQIANASVAIPSAVSAGTGGIDVTATEKASLNATSGGLSGGGSAGVGASANVAVLKSTNAARIVGSTISAPGEVDVIATSTRDINLITVTAGLGGTGGIAGNVGVLLVGDAANGDQTNALGSNVSSVGTATNTDTSGALGAGVDGISASIEGGTVTANKVAIHATGDIATSNIAGALGVGVVGGFGAAVAYTTVGQVVTAKDVGGTLQVANLDVNATAGDDPVGGKAVGTLAVAGAGGFVGLGAAVAVSSDKNTVTSLVGGTVDNGISIATGSPVTLVANSVSIAASDTSSVRADGYGAAGGGAAIGASIATASRTSVVTAEVLTGADPTVSNGANLTALLAAQNVSLDAEGSGQTYALAIAGAAGGLAGVGASATAGDNSMVLSSVVGGSTIIAPNLTGSAYGLSVLASDTPDAKAFSFGVALGGTAALGASVTDAKVASTVTSNVDGAAHLNLTNGLQVRAVGQAAGTPATSFPASGTIPSSTDAFTSGTTNAAAWSIAGSGGGTFAANATDAKAENTTQVTAQTGSGLLLPGGAVSITASNTTVQYAQGTGVAVSGVLAVGLVLVDGEANTQTIAQIGSSTTSPTASSSNPLTDLTLAATGSDTTNAQAFAGAGGTLAGNGAQAQTKDTATTMASIGANAGITARSITISATHTDNFYEMGSSLNASVVGASAALSSHDAASNVLVTLGSGVSLDATAAGLLACANNACAQAVNITATNAFNDAGSGTSAAAGGGINGAGATSTVDLHTSSTSIEIGSGDYVASGTDPGLAPGGIAVTASSNYQIADTSTLGTGGVIQGAGVSSTVRGTISNTINVDAGAQIATKGSISLATYTQGSASANGYVTTYGLAAVGTADALVDITNNQTINIFGSSSAAPAAWTTLAAFYDVFVQAGEYGGHGLSSSYNGSTVASGYVRGLVAVPTVDATTNVASNATVNFAKNSGIYSGQSVKIGAYHEAPTVTADGAGHGYELGFIPVTKTSNNHTAPPTADVTIGGTIVAGQYRTLLLTVNADGTVTANAGSAPVNYSYLVNPTVSCASALTTSCLFTADEYSTLLSHGDIGAGSINAIRFGALFASAGNVEVHADTLHGAGAISAYGSPSITVNNANNIALVFYGGAYIPDVTGGGQITYTGAASSTSATAAGIVQNASGSSTAASITINQTYAGGDPGAGPPIIVDAGLTNLGGSLSITNANGSLVYQTVYATDANGNALDGSNGQTAQVVSIGGSQASQQNITVPHGALIINANTPDGLYVAGASPASEFDGSTVYPGGENGSNANGAIQYVAASIYQNHLESADQLPFNTSQTGNTGINGTLYGVQTTSAAQNSIALLDGCQFNRAMCVSDSTYNSNTGAYFVTSDGKRHVAYTNPSLSSSAGVGSINTAGSLQSKQIYGNLIEIYAATIDVNGAIYAGPPTTYNLSINNGQAIRANYSNGGNVDISSQITFGNDSARDVTATYNSSTNQITLSKINAYSTGASVLLDGNIISTNTIGNIHVNSGFGQVSINNTTGIPLVLQDINTGSTATASAATSTVTIVDRLKDLQSGSSNNDTTTYVYNPGTGLKTYLTNNGASPLDRNGNLIAGAALISASNSSVASYSPVAGAAYEYVEEATLVRYFTTANGPGNWVFSSGSGSNPYYYVSPDAAAAAGNNVTTSGHSTAPIGKVILGSTSAPAYSETIFGNVISYNKPGNILGNGSVNQVGSYQFGYQGYQYVSGNSGDKAGNPNYVIFYPDQAFVRLINTVRADNPFSINFTGNLNGLVSVSSNAAVTIAGAIKDPNGWTLINTTSGNASASITQSAGLNLSGSNVTLQAGGALGSAADPINATVTSGLGTTVGSFSGLAYGGGLYVNLTSGANGFFAMSGGGDVVVNATGSLLYGYGGLTATGNNVTLQSTQGSVGTLSTPLSVQTATGGVVNVSAYGDIGLSQASGDMLIGQIASTAGSVAIRVANGNVYDSLSQTSASSLSSAQVNAIASSLNLNGARDAAAGAASVTSFEASVNSSLARYNAFLAKGTIVAASSVLLDGSTLSLYAPLANSAAIQVQRANQTGTSSYASLTNAQVQASANSSASSNGVFQITITSSNRANYQSQAAQALGIADPATVSDTQIQAWANAQYQTYATTFTQAYGSGWANQVATDSARQSTVNGDLSGYNNLLAAGTVTNGSYSLATSSVEAYRNQTALALNIADASTVTTAQIRTYTGSLYQTYASDLSGALGGNWQTAAQGMASFSPFAVTAGSALANALTSSSKWTAQQLVQAIDVSALQPASSIVGSNARADIIGQNVNLTVLGGSIGTYNPNGLQLSFQHLTNETLSSSELAALSTASSPGSVTLIGTGPTGSALPAGTDLATLAPGSVVSAIQIAQTKPVFVNASGALTINASSTVYLQGTAGSSFNIAYVTAGGDVSLASPASIAAATLAGSALSQTQIVTSGNLSLVAGSGGIGTSIVPLVTQVGGAYVNISAAGDVFMRSAGNDARIERLYAGGNATLTSDTGYALVSALTGVNVQANNIVLVSGGDIGTATNALAVRTTGVLTGSAAGAANIYGAPIGGGQNNDLSVSSFAAGGTLKIGAQGTLQLTGSLSSTGGMSVTAGSLLMAATATLQSAGVLSISTLYDATLASLASTAASTGGAATVSVNAGGTILVASGPAATITTGTNGAISLVSSGDIGSSTAMVAVNTPRLSVNSTAGSVYIAGSSALHATSLQAGGSLRLTDTGSLTVDLANVSGSLDIVSSGGAVMLGTATSGGTLTSEAKNALTYNGLRSTAGDIKLASDTASVKGIASNGIADTLDAAGGFQIVAATDVAAGSLKADTAAGSIRSLGGSVNVATANTGTSLGVVATGAVGLASTNTGTTFDATSSSGALTLGTARSGGTQTIEANGALTYNALQTSAGDISLASDTASVTGTTNSGHADTLETKGGFQIVAATDVSASSLKSDTAAGGIHVLGGAVNVATTSTGSSLVVNAAGTVALSSVLTGTTFDATSSGGAVSLGSAISGGTQTVEARNALSYTALQTTAGDIKLTSNAAGVSGLTSGGVADALEARGGFQIVAATGVTANSLKADTGAGSVQALGGALNLATATTGTALTLAATGPIGASTVTTGSTFDATSSGGSVSLGHAISGGTQTVEAQNALTYAALQTTSGDIRLASDTASVKGVAIGNVADKLEAKGGFQIVAATDVSATSLKADTAAGTIRSLTGTTIVASSSTGTSLGVTAGNGIQLASVTTGTTFDATSAGGAVTLGTAVSGGTQTVEANNTLTYTALQTTAGDIALTSDKGGVQGVASNGVADTLEAEAGFRIVAAGNVLVNSLTADTGAGSIRSAGAMNVATVNTGTTLAATSTGGAVTLGAAHSGGTQTVEANNALTYTALQTTAGDISLTSDTAAVQGVAANGVADTLEAKGGFQIAAATDVVGSSSKADTGAGSIRAIGGIVSVVSTNTASSLGVTAANAVHLGTSTTGTTFDVTSSGGSVTLGSVTSGGTQTIEAKNALTYTALRTTAGDIALTSDTAAVQGVAANGVSDTLEAKGGFQIAAATDITATSLKADTGAGNVRAIGGGINATTVNSGTSLGVTAANALHLGTVTTGTTFDAASSGGAVTLGTAVSGGTQTVEAKNALTYTALRTTAGDIALTSDTAAVQGVAANGVSDTLEAKGGFQIAAATDVTATSLKADTGAGNVRAIGGGINATTVNSGTSLGVAAANALHLGTVTTGTTFDAASSAGAVTLGTVVSGGTQTVEANNALTYTALRTTAGDIALTSDTAAVQGVAANGVSDTLEAKGGFQIAAATDITATSLKADTGAGNVRAIGGGVNATTVNSGTSLGVTAANALHLGTVTTGTTFDAASSAGAVTLGTAVSGGTQTVEANNALTYTALRTTAGDIALTSDTAGVSGAASGSVADTLEAKGGFQIVAATDVSAYSLKADTASGSIRSLGGAVNVAATNTGTSFGVTANGNVGLATVAAGATFDATSAAGAVTLGNVESGGSQHVSASGDVTFATLRTTGSGSDPGDVALQSTSGSLLGGDIFAANSISAQGRNIGFGTFSAGRNASLDAVGQLTGTNVTAAGSANLLAGAAMAVSTIKANDISLATPTSLAINRLDVGRELALAADAVSVGTVTAPGALTLTLTGFGGSVGTKASLYIDAASISVPQLRFVDTTLATSAASVSIQDAVVPGTLGLMSPAATIDVNDRTPLPRLGSTLQLFQPSQNFFLYQNGNATYTNAYVVQFAPGVIVTGDVVGAPNANPSFVNDLPRIGRVGDDSFTPGALPGDALSRFTAPMAGFVSYLSGLNGVAMPTSSTAAVNLDEADSTPSLVPGTLTIVSSKHAPRP